MNQPLQKINIPLSIGAAALIAVAGFVWRVATDTAEMKGLLRHVAIEQCRMEAVLHQMTFDECRETLRPFGWTGSNPDPKGTP